MTHAYPIVLSSFSVRLELLIFIYMFIKYHQPRIYPISSQSYFPWRHMWQMEFTWNTWVGPAALPSPVIPGLKEMGSTVFSRLWGQRPKFWHWAITSGRTRCHCFVCLLFVYSCKSTTRASVSHVHTQSTDFCSHPAPSIRHRFTSLTTFKKVSNSFI